MLTVIESMPLDAVPGFEIVGKLKSLQKGFTGKGLVFPEIRAEAQAGKNVMTGQQPGLLGGPAMILWKLAGAVSSASEKNSSAFFWVGGHDDDTSEADSVKVVLNDQAVDLKVKFRERKQHVPLSKISADQAVRSISLKLSDTEYFETVKKAYSKQGATLDTAFCDCLSFLVGSHKFEWAGSVTPEWRKKTTGLLEKLLFTIDAPGVLEKSAQAFKQAGFDAPLAPEPGETGLFLFRNGQRYKLLRKNGGFEAAGLGALSRQEIEKIIDEDPGSLLPNVWSRLLLATKAYEVGLHLLGPGEMAYALQAAPLFSEADVCLPRFCFRPSMTILSAWREDLMGRSKDWIGSPVQVGQTALQRAVPDEIRFASEVLKDSFDSAEESFTDAVSRHAPKLLKNLKKEFSKSNNYIFQVVDKTVKRAAKQTPAGLAVKKLLAYLPETGLQERELSPWSFYAQGCSVGGEAVKILSQNEWDFRHLVLTV